MICKIFENKIPNGFSLLTNNTETIMDAQEGSIFSKILTDECSEFRTKNYGYFSNKKRKESSTKKDNYEK